MKFGIDRFCEDPSIRIPLQGKRVALLAHPASVNQNLVHSIDALKELGDVKLTAAFGPQHGMKGDKQDNMVESEFYIDPQYQIPIFSLYGQVRRPTAEMMDTFDVILVDLQDLGCRIYTFITTLLYVLEEAARRGKSVWVLDRPNPVGRPVEGLTLREGWESFVGAGPLPMRHGLTLGELGHWFIDHGHLSVDYRVVQMQSYFPNEAPGWGWPLGERAWINPSPNAPGLSMARNYPGSVLLEGTTISEGRGTTRPLEGMGAPDIQMRAVLGKMMELAPSWLEGCIPRIHYFEPTFHKHQGKLCEGIQFHVEDPHYHHMVFKPYRIYALFFKALRILRPQYPLWRSFPYEYEFDRLAIDLINGGPELREWVDDLNSTPADLERLLKKDEEEWTRQSQRYQLY